MVVRPKCTAQMPDRQHCRPFDGLLGRFEKTSRHLIDPERLPFLGSLPTTGFTHASLSDRRARAVRHGK